MAPIQSPHVSTSKEACHPFTYRSRGWCLWHDAGVQDAPPARGKEQRGSGFEAAVGTSMQAEDKSSGYVTDVEDEARGGPKGDLQDHVSRSVSLPHALEVTRPPADIQSPASEKQSSPKHSGNVPQQTTKKQSAAETQDDATSMGKAAAAAAAWEGSPVARGRRIMVQDPSIAVEAARAEPAAGASPRQEPISVQGDDVKEAAGKLPAQLSPVARSDDRVMDIWAGQAAKDDISGTEASVAERSRGNELHGRVTMIPGDGAEGANRHVEPKEPAEIGSSQAFLAGLPPCLYSTIPPCSWQLFSGQSGHTA